MIVKSCKIGRCSAAVLTLLSPQGREVESPSPSITQLATNTKCNLLNVDFLLCCASVLGFADCINAPIRELARLPVTKASLPQLAISERSPTHYGT